MAIDGFAERQRKAIASEVGCMALLSGVATLAFIAALLTGSSKIATVLIIAPLALLITPIYWLIRLGHLKSALARKQPQPVLEYFLEDLKPGYADEAHVPVFAFDSLAAEEQQRIGDAPALQQRWRDALEAFVDEGLDVLRTTDNCRGCGASIELLKMDLPKGAIVSQWAGAYPARCGRCQARYCAQCTATLLTGEKKLLGEQFPDCHNCQKEFQPEHVPLHTRERMTDPVFIKESLKQTGREEGLTRYAVTGSMWFFATAVQVEKNTSTGPQNKGQAFSPGELRMEYALRQENGEWRLQNGLPELEKTLKPRWREIKDDPTQSGPELA